MVKVGREINYRAIKISGKIGLSFLLGLTPPGVVDPIPKQVEEILWNI